MNKYNIFLSAVCFLCQKDWLHSWTLLCSCEIFDVEFIQLCSFLRTVHNHLQKCTFSSSEVIPALNTCHREKCKGNLACPPPSPAGVVPPFCDRAATAAQAYIKLK